MTAHETTAGRIDEYLRFARQRHEDNAASKETDSRLRRVAKHAVPTRRRGTARMILTDAVRPWQRRRVARFLDRDPLLLHVGSGGQHKDGWVNIDLVGDPVEVGWNLARGLPFPDDCAHGLFSEHLLEHLPLDATMTLLAECKRVLRPGGVIRTGVPDAGALLHSYVRGGEGFLEATRPGRPTAMLAVQELFYWHRHLVMFDAETLTLVLEESGFTDVAVRDFGQTDLPACPDTERRRAETLYVEARA